MKLHKSKRKTNRKIGGVLKDDDIFRFKEGKYVYDDQNVEKQYSTLKNTLKLSPPSEPNLAKDFFKNNNDLLRNIFEFSVKAGKKFKVIQQFLQKYPKLEKVIIHFLGYPTQDTSDYFDISDITSEENFELNMSYSIPNDNGRPVYIENENVQSYLAECIQIKVLDNYFKILNETEYAEPNNATALEVDALKLKIEKLKGHIIISVNLKDNADLNKSTRRKGVGIDDLIDGIDSSDDFSEYYKSVWASLTYSDVKEVFSFNKDKLECSTRIKTPLKTPIKTLKRKQYPLATRKSARLQR